MCLGWPWTTILQISAFQVTGIAGESHQHLAASKVLRTWFHSTWIHTQEWNCSVI
jgi:hypothetical protein